MASSCSASGKAGSRWPIAARIRCSCSRRCSGSWAIRRCRGRQPADKEQALLPQLARRLEQLETRLKMVEEEQRGGMDLTKFYERAAGGGSCTAASDKSPIARTPENCGEIAAIRGSTRRPHVVKLRKAGVE